MEVEALGKIMLLSRRGAAMVGCLVFVMYVGAWREVLRLVLTLEVAGRAGFGGGVLNFVIFEVPGSLSRPSPISKHSMPSACCLMDCDNRTSLLCYTTRQSAIFYPMSAVPRIYTASQQR